MLRLLIILALSLYILSKIGSFFFRIAASQNRNPHARKQDGSAHDDVKKGKRGTIKGGDYVDYEEVK